MSKYVPWEETKAKARLIREGKDPNDIDDKGCTLTGQEYLAIVRRVTKEWQAEMAGKVEPDPKYATDEESQYPETVELLSAPVEAEAELQERIRAAVVAAGDYRFARWHA